MTHDFTYEGKRFVQAKMPSLSDYDHDDLNDEGAEQRLNLDRWGDLHTPFRLNELA